MVILFHLAAIVCNTMLKVYVYKVFILLYLLNIVYYVLFSFW